MYPDLSPLYPDASDTTVDCGTGDQVEVRSRFDGSWSRGFQIERLAGDRVMLRRRSDGMVLPVWFPITEIRPADRAA